MTKKKKLTTKHFVLIGVLSLALIGGVTIASANLSFMDRIADKAGEILGISLSEKIDIPVDESETLAGSGGTFQTDWYKVGNRVTWIKSGQFVDGSVVLFSFLNPVDYGKATGTDATWNALTHETSTSTVVSVNLDITGAATSSARIVCGAASSATVAPTYALINLDLPTSTIGVFSDGQATTTSGIGAIGTGSGGEVDFKVLLTHDYDYFNCVATSTGATGHVANWIDGSGAVKGYTGDTNTFDGYWSVEVIKNLQ